MRKKTKFNKIFSVLLAVLMLLSAFPIASFAISEGDTVNVSGTSNWISGFYYNFNGNFGTGKHGQHQRIRANGQVAYCVEPGKSLSSGNKTAKENWDGLSTEQKNLVTAAFLYGYSGTPKYGYSDDTEEVATQTVIWAIALNAFNNSNEELLLSCAFGGSTNSTNRAKGWYDNFVPPCGKKIEELPELCEKADCRYNSYRIYCDNDVLVTCFEIKISKADFHSKHGHNFIGNANFYVMPKELYLEVKDEIPDGIGVIAYISTDKFDGLRCVKQSIYRQISSEDKMWIILSVLKKVEKNFQKNLQEERKRCLHGMKPTFY